MIFSFLSLLFSLQKKLFFKIELQRQSHVPFLIF